jgi:hypothetical protein
VKQPSKKEQRGKTPLLQARGTTGKIIGYKKNKMSTDRESGRGNKRDDRKAFIYM